MKGALTWKAALKRAADLPKRVLHLPMPNTATKYGDFFSTLSSTTWGMPGLCDIVTVLTDTPHLTST